MTQGSDSPARPEFLPPAEAQQESDERLSFKPEEAEKATEVLPGKAARSRSRVTVPLVGIASGLAVAGAFALGRFGAPPEGLSDGDNLPRSQVAESESLQTFYLKTKRGVPFKLMGSKLGSELTFRVVSEDGVKSTLYGAKGVAVVRLGRDGEADLTIAGAEARFAPSGDLGLATIFPCEPFTPVPGKYRVDVLSRDGKATQLAEFTVIGLGPLKPVSSSLVQDDFKFDVTQYVGTDSMKEVQASRVDFC